MNKYRISTVRELRREFWATHLGYSGISKKKIMNYAGTARNMYNTDTRTAWCDFLDMLSKNGDISQRMAHNSTL